MPIFFHLESHLWIAYALLLNGFLLHCLFRDTSTGYFELTKPLEAQALAAFFISLILNGTLLLLLGLVGVEFSVLRFGLPIITLVLAFILWRRLEFSRFIQLLASEWSVWRLLIYGFVFVVLFYNGGLIEQTSDAWWHMSLANKIAFEGSFFLEQGHLSGIADRYYPPLWHGNLALLTSVSDIGLPIIWNSFTAWGGVLKVIGFFLLAWSLSKNSVISTLSVLLFVLLPGMGDSYLRVSAWPSHIAYTALFASFYVGFHALDIYQRERLSADATFRTTLRAMQALLVVGAGLLFILTFTHLAEVLWLFVAVFFYLTGLCVYRVFSGRDYIDFDGGVSKLYVLMVVGILIVCLWFLLIDNNPTAINLDLLIAYSLPILVLCILALSRIKDLNNNKILMLTVAQWGLLGLGVLLILSIDARHLFSLFNPELAYPRASQPQYPLIATGWFGGELKIPGWHLQLRGALLYSGVVAILLSIPLAIFRPSRLSLFLASTAVLAFLFCVSPYLHHWLRYLLSYHSPWRIAILIFHPIIIASVIYYLWELVVGRNKKKGLGNVA